MSGKSPGPDALADDLRRRIRRHGTIGFDEFMAAALYDTESGYYAAAESRTGRRGDFFTSVSVGPVFGRMLAAQFAEMHEALGCPADFTLVEQGTNDGQLMADVLSALEQHHPACPARVVIIEPLPRRRAAQREKLGPWTDRLRHVANEQELPPFTGVFFANELLDAFPVKLLVRESGTWRERRVGLEGDAFVLVETLLEDDAATHVAGSWPIPEEAERFCTEFCPSLEGWLGAVAGKLTRGWMLLIDYGHPAPARFHPARAAGTLAAYRDHQRQNDPLADPGRQDLTAHVDFSRVARVAERAGCHLAGFTDQNHALTALAARVYPAMPAQSLAPDAAREMRALRQLLHPESMGTAFKFLGLSRGIATPLTAFAFAREPRRELFG